jgi:hypothetical protein
MKYIVLDWKTYLSNPEFWQKVSNDYLMPLHIGEEAAE